MLFIVMGRHSLGDWCPILSRLGCTLWGSLWGAKAGSGEWGIARVQNRGYGGLSWLVDRQGPDKVVWGIGNGEKGRGLSHPAASLKVWWTTLHQWKSAEGTIYN